VTDDLILSRPAGRARPEDAERFGTDAFYVAIGRAFVAMCSVVPLLFLIEGLDLLTGRRFALYGGIQPRSPAGLDGIVLAPFLHASFAHVLANSVPLILLGTFVMAAGARRFLAATMLISIVSGLGVWLTGDPRSIVVGASGVIFGYVGVLLVRGVVAHSWWNAAVGILVGVLYGWQVLAAVVPADPSVSWQAHLFGFTGGVLAGVIFRRRRPRPPRTVSPGGPGDTLALPTEPLSPA
jgi:membrane associated rhomboid family serine protease